MFVNLVTLILTKVPKEYVKILMDLKENLNVQPVVKLIGNYTMKVNWKKVSQSKGYKSLKASYIKSIKHKWRNKESLTEHFHWIICRAKHYAHYLGTTIDVILDEWESNRKMDWINYYYKHSYHLRRLDKSEVWFPEGPNGLRKRLKSETWWPNNPQQVKNAVCRKIMDDDRERVKKSGRKPRWTKKHKEYRAWKASIKKSP